MIVLCLEGCHGSGKTELCERFAMEGFPVLREAFLDMPSYGLHPQSLLMETSWICTWFERVLQENEREKGKNQMKKGKQKSIMIADRSPYSAVFYCDHGELLKGLIDKQMEELEREAGIEIYTVYLSAEKDRLWKRVEARLADEPGRAKVKEDRREWLDKVIRFYDSFSWDMQVDNSEEETDMKRLMTRTLQTAREKIPAMESIEAFTLPCEVRDCGAKVISEEQKETEKVVPSGVLGRNASRNRVSASPPNSLC